MKKVIIFTALLLIFTATAFTLSAQERNKTITFQTNLHCDSCRAKIEDSIPFEKGIKDVVVDVPAKTVTVTYDTKRTNPELIRKALVMLGYDAKIIEREANAVNSVRPQIQPE